MPELSLAEVALRVGLAAVLGGAIGAERELREREAGLRREEAPRLVERISGLEGVRRIEWAP